MNRHWPEITSGSRKLTLSLSPRELALLALITLIYFAAGKVGQELVFVYPYLTPISLPSGIAFAAFILFGYRVWPAVLLGSFLGHVSTVGFVATTMGFVMPSLTISAGVTLEGLAGAYLVNKFAQGMEAFDTAQDTFRFVLLACICAPSIGATLGVGRFYLAGKTTLMHFGFMWLTWWLAHGIGILLVAPFLILLLRATHHRLDWHELGELTVLVLGLIFVCLLVFGPLSLSLNKNQIVQAWVCVPFLVWAGFRFCPLEAAGTTLILFGSAIWGTLHGYGSFVGKDLTTSLVLLDTFIGIIGTMTLVVAAMVVERSGFEGELLGVHGLLREAVEERDHALEAEAADHAQTKKALQESQKQLRELAGNKRPEETATTRSPRERLE
jgi:integral membrane sensor domain MASE1